MFGHLDDARILVLGANYDQLPMIACGIRLGCRVFVCDRNPEAPGLGAATVPLTIDTSDVDALVEVVREHGIRGVCTMATNLAPRAVAEVCERTGLPGIAPHAAADATDKAAMRRLCADAGIPIAEGGEAESFQQAESLAGAVGVPVVLKPSDSSGCRGIQVVLTVDQLEEAFVRARSAAVGGIVVVERFYENARVFGAESLIVNGQTHTIVVAEKIVRTAPALSTAGVTISHDLDPRISEQAAALSERINRCLGLSMGASHIDFVLDGDTLRVIDVGPRLAGGPLIFELAQRLTGVDMVEHVIRGSLGHSLVPIPKPVDAAGIERFLYAPVDGVLEGFTVPGASQGMLSQWRKRTGDALIVGGSNTERLGFVTAVRDSVAEAEAAVAEFARGITFDVRTPSGAIQTHRPLLFPADGETSEELS